MMDWDKRKGNKIVKKKHKANIQSSQPNKLGQ